MTYLPVSTGIRRRGVDMVTQYAKDWMRSVVSPLYALSYSLSACVQQAVFCPTVTEKIPCFDTSVEFENLLVFQQVYYCKLAKIIINTAVLLYYNSRNIKLI